MSQWSIGLDPLLSPMALVVLAVVAGALALYGLVRGLRGSWLRVLAILSLLAALLNPSLVQEEREPLKSVIAVVVDQSDSQKFAERANQTETALAAFKDRMARFPQFELREVNVKSVGTSEDEASSALFGALQSALQDVPAERVGGAVMITDGQVHDVPDNAQALGFDAPLHALITGAENDRDRRIEIVRAPRFGLVGGNQEIVFKVDETNIPSSGGPVEVRVSIDGELVAIEQAFPGEEASFFFDVPHGGKNVIEFKVDGVDGELTLANNLAFSVLDGIRENLRVLLVSGEPHAGERTWRNLLKSDASVDLVHFTILRPPEKQDGTPINQLSLIAFPTRELFIEKIDEFDLIIFDRYKRRGVLPVLYFDNIARYVSEGGAILVAAGPEHAGPASIHRTPLASILPAEPMGDITTRPYKPSVSDLGRRHPVTRGLDGAARGTDADADNAKWSRWFRLIDTQASRGDVVMRGADDKPLLVLDRPGEGRIAMLMSDHVWLWARGFEGGGPHTQLLRRLGHWLMKEPELSEEALRAETNGDTIRFERQTMGEEAGQFDLITPDGKQVTVPLEDIGDGRFAGEYKAETLGLYRAANGDLTALTHVGPVNPLEYSQIVSTAEKLLPLVNQTGGLIKRLGQTNIEREMPRIVPVRATGSRSGNEWMGFKNQQASVLKGVQQLPLFTGFLGLFVLLMAAGAMWAREGR